MFDQLEALKSALALAEESVAALEQELAAERAAHALTSARADEANAALHAERMRIHQFAKELRTTLAKGGIDG